MSTHDRVQLQKYKEQAIRKEEELSTRLQIAEISDFLSEAETQSNVSYEVDQSSRRDSNLQTEQVMEFIRQALSDASHIEEVKLLQSAIFEELQKYTHSESCDTLHNFNDISTNDGTFTPISDLSPIKSIVSEQVSPPKCVEECETVFDQMCTQLSVPKDHLVTPEFSQNSSDHVPSINASEISHFSRGSEFSETPKFVRRNSYTLESPSTSILAYLKSLNKEVDNISQKSKESPSLSKNKVARNISDQFELSPKDIRKKNEVHSLSNSCIELNYSPVTSNPKEHKTDKNFNYDDDQDVITALNQKTKPLSSNNSKKGLFENNNVTPEMERAAAKIQAGIRGYLTRRLLRTFKVVELKNTIKDSLITALQLHTEPAINKAEVELHKRLALQVESVCREWHSIFFEIPSHERMKLIEIDREKSMVTKKPKTALRRVFRTKPKTGYESADSLATTSSSYSTEGRLKR